jgi:hypothetical protein
LTRTSLKRRSRWGGEANGSTHARGETTTSDADGDQTGVEDRLADIYGGRTELPGRYLLVGLAIAGAWWLLFGPFSAFFAAMGLVALATGVDPARTALAARGWPRTEAVVLESRVFTLRELRDSFPGLDRTGATRGGYVPFVRYEYTVDGKRHVNVRVSPFDGPIPRRRWAERLAGRYPENSQLTVPYDPAEPSRSFLRTRTRSTRLLFFLLGTVAFFVSALWLAVGSPLPAGVDIPGVAILVAFAGLFVLLGLYLTLNALRTYRWPTTTGVVRGQDVSVNSGGEGGSTSYSPKLRYEYEVDGDSYESSRIAVGGGPSFSSRSGARDWLATYPDDDGEVTVHYNPRRPDRSVLERGGVLKGLLLLLLTGGMLAVVVVLETGNEQLVVRFLERLPV